MATPDLVQSTVSANNLADASHAWPDLYYNLPHPCQSGNCLIMWLVVENATSVSITITDDGSGNVWTLGPSMSSPNLGRNLLLWTCPNVSANTQQVRVQFGTTKIFIGGGISEWNNVATSSPVDTSASASGSSTAAAVALTTGTSGDLIFQVALQETTENHYGSSFTAGPTGTTLLHTELWYGHASAFSVQAASGAITPTINYSTSREWYSLAIALKSASAGSAMPTNVIRVRRRQFHSGSNQPDITNLANPITVQMPCADGTLVVYNTHSWAANGSSHAITSIVDQGANNFFTAAATALFNISGTIVNQAIWYTPNASSTTPIVTITAANTLTELTIAAYEVCNLQNAGVGAVSNTSGDQASPGDLTAGTITPTKSPSILFVVVPINHGTVNGSTSPTTRAFDGFWCTGMDGGFNVMEEDNAHGFYVTPDNSAVSFTWTKAVSGAAAEWAATVAEFFQQSPVYATRRFGIGGTPSTHRSGNLPL